MNAILKKKIKELGQKISGIIKLGYVTRIDSDDGLDSTVQVGFLGKTLDVSLYSPYGVSSNIPQGSTVVMAANNGSNENNIGYGSFPENRFRDLKEWELKIGNFKTKANVFFNEAGEIVVLAKSGENIVLNDGTESVIKGDTFKTNYDPHQHPTAFGPSGSVIIPLDASNFNDKVKV